jgi:YVTN family beta-propeller protein
VDLSGDATNPLGVTGNDSRPEDTGWNPGLPNVGPLREIGRGNFGVVHLAFDSELDREVAIKVLAGVLDDRARARFARERRAIGRLSGHPNIVTVYQTGIAPDGRPYILMEYLSGGSLGDRLQKGAMPWPEAVDVAIQLCSAVQAAHNEGVLHRDIKPQNVLIDRFGKSKLGDFGLAQLRDTTGTQSGTVVATVAHAAPEILEGEPATAASDVYSLASTLYALIAGRPAFVNPSDESILPMYARIAEQPVPNLRPSGVPDAVCAAIEVGMHKDPNQRIRSPAELGRRLAGALAPNEAERRPHELGRERRWRLSQPLIRHRISALIGALVLVIALGATGLTLLRSGGNANTVSPTVVTLNGGTTENIAVSRGAIWVLAGEGVAQIDPATDRVTSTIAPTGISTAIAIGDGSVWVADGYQNVVFRVDVALGRVADTIPVGRNPIAIAVSGKSVWVANGGDGTVSRINATTRRVTATIPVGSAESSYGLTGLAVGEGSVWVTDNSDGTLSRIDPARTRVVSSIQIARPGTRFLDVAAGDGTVWATTQDSFSPIQALQFDAAGRVRTRISLPPRFSLIGLISGEGHTLGVGVGALWLGTTSADQRIDSVVRIDPATRVTTLVHTPRIETVTGLAVDPYANAVWVAGNNLDTSAFVVRISP